MNQELKTKQCSCCLQIKPITQFNRLFYTKDKHDYTCKECKKQQAKQRKLRIIENRKTTTSIPETKICTKCNIIKSINSFSKCSKTIIGYKEKCKDCAHSEYKTHYKLNKDTINLRHKKYNLKNKSKLALYYKNIMLNIEHNIISMEIYTETTV